MSKGNSCYDADEFITDLELLETQGYEGPVKGKSALNTCTKSGDAKSGDTKQRNKFMCIHCKKIGHTTQYCYTPEGGAEHKHPAYYKPPLEFVD